MVLAAVEATQPMEVVVLALLIKVTLVEVLQVLLLLPQVVVVLMLLVVILLLHSVEECLCYLVQVVITIHVWQLLVEVVVVVVVVVLICIIMVVLI